MQPRREVPSNADVFDLPLDGPEMFHLMELKMEIADFHVGEQGEETPHNGGHDGAPITVLQVIDQLHAPVEEGGVIYTHARDHTDAGVDHLSVDPGNEITCEGDLPSFPLPPPYSIADFQNPQQLCAVQWFGGLS